MVDFGQVLQSVSLSSAFKQLMTADPTGSNFANDTPQAKSALLQAASLLLGKVGVAASMSGYAAAGAAASVLSGVTSIAASYLSGSTHSSDL